MELTIGFSPCPNDTFIFDAMINGKIDTEGIIFVYKLEDVETLNQWAYDKVLDITKLSYNAFLHTVDNYSLLNAGSALGKGVGPILIAKEPIDLNNLSEKSIAIPGKNTTANLLLSLALPNAQNKQETIFSDIEEGVLNGQYDIGLIIHESRFTYEQKGLVKLIDLGDWWEEHSGAAIPLGGIVIKRSINPEIAAKVDRVIKRSLEYAWEQYPQLNPFITNNAQEMEEAVMKQHIELYVNEYSLDLGKEGSNTINTLFKKAKEAGIITTIPNNIFYPSSST